MVTGRAPKGNRGVSGTFTSTSRNDQLVATDRSPIRGPWFLPFTGMELTIEQRLELKSKLRGVGYLCEEVSRLLDDDRAFERAWRDVMELVEGLNARLSPSSAPQAAA